MTGTINVCHVSIAAILTGAAFRMKLQAQRRRPIS